MVATTCAHEHLQTQSYIKAFVSTCYQVHACLQPAMRLPSSHITQQTLQQPTSELHLIYGCRPMQPLNSSHWPNKPHKYYLLPQVERTRAAHVRPEVELARVSGAIRAILGGTTEDRAARPPSWSLSMLIPPYSVRHKLRPCLTQRDCLLYTGRC